jgi:hypothetical protein
VDYSWVVKVCTPSYVKGNMAKVLDAALAGQPTIIFRKGRLAIVKEYDPQTDSLSRLEAAFAEGGGPYREPTAAERRLIRTVSRRK